jgi:hypothetical protein
MKAFVVCWLLLLVACGGEVEETPPDPACAECALSVPGSYPIWSDGGDMYCIDGEATQACETVDDCFVGEVCEAGFCESETCG